MPRGNKAGGSAHSPTLTDMPMRPTAAPRTVDIALVAPNPRNLREDDLWTSDDERDETVASMQATGLLQALLVCNRDAFLDAYPEQEARIGDAKYVIIAGHRRYAAAQLAGLKKVRIDVRDELIPDMDVVMLEENLKRKALTVFQEGEGYRRIAAKGLSHAAIAKKVGKGKSTITKRIALLDLPDTVKQAVLDKKLSVDSAYNLMVALGPEYYDKLLEAAAILKKDRNATAADAVNQLLIGSARTDETGPSETETPTTSEPKPVLTEPAEAPAPAQTATLTQTKQDPEPSVPAARTGAETEAGPVLTEPAAEPDGAAAPALKPENAGRAQAAAARNEHCAHLVKQEEKPPHDPQTVTIASTFLTQASPAALKRAHAWMVAADAPDALSFEAGSYRDAVLVRHDAPLISRLAYAVALAEDELRASNRSRNWDYRDIAHLQHLIDSGYEPTEWERRHLG